MADFVLKRNPGFKFQIEGYPEEGAEKVFTIPAPSQLSFEDVEKMKKMDLKDQVLQLLIIQSKLAIQEHF